MKQKYIITAEDSAKIKEYRKQVKDKYLDRRLYAVQLLGEGKTAKEISIKTVKLFEEYLDKNKCLMEYKDAKAKLYSKEEVKEYLSLEKKISNIISSDFLGVYIDIHLSLSNINIFSCSALDEVLFDLNKEIKYLFIFSKDS